MSTSVQLTYQLTPPSDVQMPETGSKSVQLSASATFPLRDATSTTAYYASASSAILAAQSCLNEALTPWKEAIGDREKHKEDPGKVARGQGKAARMMETAADASGESEDDAEAGEGGA